MNIPAEFTIGGIYMPPLLMASVLGVITATIIARLFTATIIARLLNTYRLSKYFFYPPLVFVAMAIIFTIIYGVLIIPF